jgi:hypothetical protein
VIKWHIVVPIDIPIAIHGLVHGCILHMDIPTVVLPTIAILDILIAMVHGCILHMDIPTVVLPMVLVLHKLQYIYLFHTNHHMNKQ